MEEGRIQKALQSSGGDPVSFIKAMSALDKESLDVDFRSYLRDHPENRPGLLNIPALHGRDGDASTDKGYGGTGQSVEYLVGVPAFGSAPAPLRRRHRRDQEEKEASLERAG